MDLTWAEMKQSWRPPNWRWLAACAIRQGWRAPQSIRLDEGIRSLLDEERPHDHTTTIDCASDLYLTGGWRRSELEARLLADETAAVIATKMGLPCDVVRLYHDCFFDVRERLKHTSVIVHEVLEPDTPEGLDTDDKDRLLKRYAYFGGPVVLETVLSFLRDPPDLASASKPLREPERTRLRDYPCSA